MLGALKRKIQKWKEVIADCSCDHLIRLISNMPRTGVCPLLPEKIYAPFWIIHLFLATYVYIVGVIFYQLYDSLGFINTVCSLFNVLVAMLIYNNSFWFLLKRKEINELLNLALANDALVIKQGRFLDIYRNRMMKTKAIVVTCYMFHFVNDILVFIPSRTLDMSSFSIATCVGLEPLSSSPNRELCMLILTGQELTSSVVVVSYDIFILFLYSYMTSIFQILCKEMESFGELSRKFDGSTRMWHEVNDRLKNLIVRHSLVLLTVNKLQKLLNIAIGIVLVLNTISVCTFFVLPLEIGFSFAPLIYYTLTVFFLYCLLGQRLINASEEFETAVYSCGWENLELRHQKVVLLILKQAQKPVILHAADMVPICMTTFASTMQAIYKFITVFRV